MGSVSDSGEGEEEEGLSAGHLNRRSHLVASLISPVSSFRSPIPHIAKLKILKNKHF